MTKTLLVTGATAGFGAAIVERFVSNVWRIVATGRRAERLQALVDRHGPDRVHAAAFDIRDLDAMHAALDAIPAPFRDIDVLVNDAGRALGTLPAQRANQAHRRPRNDPNATAPAAQTYRQAPNPH